jgi:exodeoxyribonuclease VII large subunit
MPRQPFNPLNTAAMRNAAARKSALAANPDAPPLSPADERALIELAAASAPANLAPTAQAAPAPAATGSATRPLTVKQLNALVNGLLRTALPDAFFIQGEISNFRTYDRGHAFFTLKEAGAELPCVLWKDALERLKFRPTDGMAAIARGCVKLYEPQGKLQLYVETLIPQGAGSLELAFRQLCDKLRAEGLFEAHRKRPLPKLPQTVAIITSRTGDVLHDVLTTAYRRFPGLHTLLYPVRVQGDQAAPDIAKAIHALNTHELKIENRKLKIDLILLVRGGGSLEDLWAFNEEIVARAICASRIPIATGIGHEPDTTIADLVGDLRGPTPTGITELTIPDVQTLLAALDAKQALLTRDLRRHVEYTRANLARAATTFEITFREALRNRQQRIDILARLVARIEPRHAIAQGWRRVEDAQRRLEKALHARILAAADALSRAHARLDRASPLNRIHRQGDRVEVLASRLQAAIRRRSSLAADALARLNDHLRMVSPQSVLDRGFSITTDADGRVIRNPTQVKKGDLLTTRLAEGTITSTVGKPKQASLF